MTRLTPVLLVALLAVSACQLTVTPPDPKRSAAPGTARAGDGPSAAPSATPSKPGTPVASSTPPAAPGATPAAPGASAAPRLLLKPAAASATLRGTVAIDASYLVDAKAGSVLSNGGNRLAAAGLGMLLAHGEADPSGNNGSALVSNNGGQLIANNSGNVIANNGSGLISDKGSGLISDKGAGLISAPAPGIPAYAGTRASLPVARGSGWRTLLQAADGVAYGTQLPAAGMRLHVVSLLDGQDVALGVDAAGTPVTTVYTNMQGGFEVYVPAALTGTVRVVAEAPGSADPRLRYALFARTDHEEAGALDEDSAAMARYAREGITARFRSVLQYAHEARKAGPIDKKDLITHFFTDAEEVVPGFALEFLGGVLAEVVAQVDANPKIGPEDFAALAPRMTDVIFSRGPDLGGIELALAHYTNEQKVDPAILAEPLHLGPALANMTQVLREVRLKVIELARGKTPAEVEAYFAAKPYLVTANKLRPAGASPYRVRKASDLADFVSQEYVPLVKGQTYADQQDLSNGDIQRLTKAVFADLGLPETRVTVLYAGAGALTLAMAPAAAEEETKQALITLVKAWDQ